MTLKRNPEEELKNFIIRGLRTLSLKYPPRTQCKADARVKRGYYQCAICKKIVPTTIKNKKGGRTINIAVDHIHPVIHPAKGWQGWDTYIRRLFCGRDGLQLLCKECHDKKSAEENRIRRGVK